jgi:hypothetical protein
MDDERIRATDDDSPIWRSKAGDIKLSDMDDKYLQNILNYSQEREYYFCNRMLIFTDKIDQILKESKRRGLNLKLKENNDYFINNQKRLNKLK